MIVDSAGANIRNYRLMEIWRRKKCSCLLRKVVCQIHTRCAGFHSSRRWFRAPGLLGRVAAATVAILLWILLIMFRGHGGVREQGRLYRGVSAPGRAGVLCLRFEFGGHVLLL